MRHQNPIRIQADQHAHAAKEVMHIARKNAGTSQSSDTRPRSAYLHAGAILPPCPRLCYRAITTVEKRLAELRIAVAPIG